VTLTVVDNHGAQATTTKTVTVSPANVPPTAVLSVTPQSGTAPLTVTASGTGSTDPNGTISSWSINFGDGATATTSSATHTYTAAGTYTVTLTVTDNGGLKSTATKTVTAGAPTTTCHISTTNRTVTVCSPTPYSTVSSPVHFVATATDTASVHAMQIYVDYVLVYQVKNTNHIDTTLGMKSGSHHIAIKAWDYRGSYMRSFSIAVQ
jgi:PKD repeat protein